MKNIILKFAVIMLFISTSSFTTKDLVGAQECVYKLYSDDGTFLGYWHTWVPDTVSCGSNRAKALAIAQYNVYN